MTEAWLCGSEDENGYVTWEIVFDEPRPFRYPRIKRIAFYELSSGAPQ